MQTDEVKNWMRQIHFSLEWRKPYEETWDRILAYLKTKYFNQLSDEDRVCVNLVHPHVRVVIPAIYSRDPDITVTPRKFNLFGDDDLVIKRAQVMQHVLRYQIKELNLKMETKLCILDAILTGLAYIKTGYESEFEKYEIGEKKPKDAGTYISELLQTMGLKEKKEEEYEEGEYRIDERIVSERPWVMRTSPYDIIVPSLSRRFEELPWIAERIICPYEQVMDNEEYDTKGLKPSANANELLSYLRGAKHQNNRYGDELEYVIKYEVWDGINKDVITLADGHDRPLLKNKSEYTFLDTRYHPYVSLRFNEVPNEYYPASDIEPAEPQLDELNETRTQMLNHKKRYNRRYAAKPGVLGAKAQEDLRTGEDGIVVEIEPGFDEQPFDQLIWPIADAALPAEVYAVETRIRDDIFTILGTSDYASQAQGGARTATEASIIATQSRFRVEERIDLIGKFLERIIRNLAMISQRYMGVEQIKDIVGRDALYWRQIFDNKQLRGEFDFNLVYASTAPINRDVENEQFIQWFTLVKDDPMINQIKLRLEAARRLAPASTGSPEDWLVPDLIEEIEIQRRIAVKSGLLFQGPEDATGSNGRVPRPNGRGGPNKLPTGQPQGLPGDRGNGVEIPGGRGGTSLA